jgi:hypothetical protein
MRAPFALATLLACAVAAAPAQAQLPAPSSCPAAPDASKLPSAAELRGMNGIIARGSRPTGSRNHVRYINWIRRQLRGVDGVDLKETPFTISRFTPSTTRLKLRSGKTVRNLAVAAPVPYSRPTGKRGVAAPLAAIEDGEKITEANARGKIVLRHAPAGSVPNAAFLLPVVSWSTYDPHNTIDPSGNFYGDFINYNARVADLRDAGTAGAAGVVFYKDLPDSQIKGHYEPYEGSRWPVPATFMGADEGKQVVEAAKQGASARITLRARFQKVSTPTITATIKGQSPQRIVVDSHTDGTNAAEDNGPVAMVAMARYLAGQPVECRPRTIQFAFVTGHFYQRLVAPDKRHGGAGVNAEQLDRDYDEGTVSAVMVLEHLGALSYSSVDRTDGGPGQRLEQNGLREIQFLAVSQSQPLVSAAQDVVRDYDMQRTILLQGADAPTQYVPSHCSFGGEGTPYNQRLLPTVAAIAAPQTLYNPRFGLEGIDFAVMRDEMIGYTELLNRIGAMSQADIAGSVEVDRRRRAAGAPTCPPEN